MIKIIFLILPFLIMLLPNRDYDLMSKEDTLAFKGIFSIVVILHHVSQIENTIPYIHHFANFGMYAVSFFFFISAYGMTKQVKLNREKYLKGFFKKRFLKLLLPIFVVTVLHIVVNILVFKSEYTLNSIFNIYKNGSSLINNGWYLNSILVIYLIFYISFKMTKNQNLSYIIFTILTISYILVLKNIGFGIWWYNSMIGMIFGMYFEIFEGKIKKILNTHIYKLLLILSVWTFYFWNNKEADLVSFFSSFGIYSNYPIVQNLICFNFIVMVILISKKINFRDIVIHKSFYYKKTKSIGEYDVNFIVKSSRFYSKFVLIRNRLLSFLGKISFEMYMIHGLIMSLLSIYLKANIVYLLTLFGLTILLSYILNMFFNKLYIILKLNK